MSIIIVPTDIWDLFYSILLYLTSPCLLQCLTLFCTLPSNFKPYHTMSSYISSRGMISYLPTYLSIYLSISQFFTPLFFISLLSTSSHQPCSPAGVLALTLGGVSHAALLTNMFDAVGFFASSIFSYYAMELGKKRFLFLFLFLLMSPCLS